MSDIQTIALATLLRNCLCAAVAANPNPPEHCCYRVGADVAYDAGQEQDLCCEGLAYVKMDDQYLSWSSFPDQDIIRQIQGSCPPAAWAVNFTIGVIRCAPTGDANFPPSCTEWDAAFVQGAHDGQALRRAACCFRAAVKADPAFLGMDVVIGRGSAPAIQGGCTERKMLLTAQMPSCDCTF